MKITYEYSYFGSRDVREPPDVLRRSAELAVSFVLTNRRHVLTANAAGINLRHGPPSTNPCWIVTLLPEDSNE